MTEIVAEISCNHGGSIHNAFRLIRAAARAGADAVKFQCFMPERVVERRKNLPLIAELMKSRDESYADLVRNNWTPWSWFPEMIALAEQLSLGWFSSVFDPQDVAFLESLHCPRYKISAFEMFAWDILKAVQETGKPYIVSVRPTPGVTLLAANHYNGKFAPLGVSWHKPAKDELDGRAHPLDPDCPMVEYHLRLEDVDTPDKDFSVTEDELAEIVGWVK